MQETETEDEESIETGELNSYEEEGEHSSGETAHRTDEIQSFRSITERAEELMVKVAYMLHFSSLYSSYEIRNSRAYLSMDIKTQNHLNLFIDFLEKFVYVMNASHCCWQEEIDKLQRKLKELQEEDDRSILSPRQKAAAASLKKEKRLSTGRYPELQLPQHISRFSMSMISKATGNFCSGNLIGEGGYGPVYKGKLGGVAVAIKLLRPHGRQGFPEYKQEVNIYILLLLCH